MREQNITATGRIKWGYAFNQWRMGWQGFARVDDNVRALKITSGCRLPLHRIDRRHRPVGSAGPSGKHRHEFRLRPQVRGATGRLGH